MREEERGLGGLLQQQPREIEQFESLLMPLSSGFTIPRMKTSIRQKRFFQDH